MALRRAVAVSQARGCVGQPVGVPVAERGDRRLLHGLLRERPVAEGPDEGGQQARPLDPDHLGEPVLRRHDCRSAHRRMTGRSSTAPSQAAGSSAAIAMASSRSAASIR